MRLCACLPVGLCVNKKIGLNPHLLNDRPIRSLPNPVHERLNLFLSLKKTDYMIDRMTFYRSFLEKLREGGWFHADWEGKGALIFLIFRHRWTNPPRRIHPPWRALCAFPSLRDITILMEYFSKSAIQRNFFVFMRIEEEKTRRIARRRGFFAVYRLCERNYFLFDCSTR